MVLLVVFWVKVKISFAEDVLLCTFPELVSDKETIPYKTL